MSKRSWLLGLVVALMLVLVIQPVASAAGFTDIQGHWAADSINLLHDMDIVKGDPDGRVRPDEPITRAEFVALLLRTEDIAVTAGQTAATFEDVPATHWAYNYVQTAKARGIANGIDATHFGLTQNVTREQAIAMIMRASAAADNTRYSTKAFADVDLTRWSAQNIADASGAGVIDSDAPTNFRPGEAATRAEVMTWLANLLDAERKASYLPADDALVQVVQNYEISSAQVITAGYPFNWDRINAQLVGYSREAMSSLTSLYDVLGARGSKWVFETPTFANTQVVFKSQHLAFVETDVTLKVTSTAADGTVATVNTTKRMQYRLRNVDGSWKLFNTLAVTK